MNKVNQTYELISKSGKVWKIKTYKLDGVYYTDISYKVFKPEFTFYSTKKDTTKEAMFKRIDSIKSYLYEHDIY